MDRLSYFTSGEWRIEASDNVTVFATNGRLAGRRSYDGLESWTVTYHTSGTYNGRINYVEDHLLRRLVFVWSTLSTGETALDLLQDAAGTTLLDLSYTADGRRLASATSALGTEAYGYATAAGATSSALNSVLRDGVASVAVSYEWPDATHSYPGGRVRSVSARDGTYAFRFAGESDNLCDTMGMDETRTSMIIDRSSPAVPVACSTDAGCGAGEACTSGACRPFTCQEYLDTGGGVVDFTRPSAISGNCPCGADSAEISYISVAGQPRRVAYRIASDGTRTSFAYDAYGRVVGRCENDDSSGTAFNGTLATCRDSDPNGGAFAAYTYRAFGGVETTLVATETRRSRMGGSLITTTFTYDSTSRRMTGRAVQGYTYNSAGVATLETQTTGYAYDASGRLVSTTGPAPNQRVDYTYYPTGSGLDTGMVQYERRFWGPGSTDYLETTYSNYTRLGRAQSRVEPNGTTTTVGYDYGGMRQLSVTRAGQLTTRGYSTGGRLTSIVEPTGRRIDIAYGSFGRPSTIEIRDSAGSTTFERQLLTYDAAGRATDRRLQRIILGAVLDHTALTWTATYESHGYRESETQGPQSPTQYFYDSAGMGLVEQFVRGDGDTIDTPTHDAFGREGSVVRNFTGVASGSHVYGYTNGTTPEVGEAAPVTVTDPSGVVRTYTWDDFGHLVRAVSNEWGTGRWYYVQGRLTQRFEPSGTRADYSYDALGRVTQIDNDATHPSIVGQDYRYHYDNAAGGVTCPAASPYACASRRGQLARVQIEYAPGSFYDMYYDYVADGQVGVEVWPDGGTTIYSYDPQGRLERLRTPVSIDDSVRYTYDSTSGNGRDQTEVVAIGGDVRSGSTWTPWTQWGTAMDYDAAGRLRSIQTHDAASASFPTVFTYRTDGRLASTRVRRRSGASAVDMVNRTYTYAVDGAAVGFSGTASGDLSRTFLFDQANRLTCATSVVGSTSCASSVVGSYAYNSADGRTSSTDLVMGALATRTYTGGVNAITSETWTGHTLGYSYQSYAAFGGPRGFDDDSAYPQDKRSYSYDGMGRLRTVQVSPAAGSVGSYQSHVITILYDHESRPFMVTDANATLGTQANTYYYYDRSDRLIGRVLTPSIAAPTTRTVDIYVPIDPLLTGIDRLEFVSGAFTSESRYYVANSPEGLPIAAYSFSTTTSAEAWRPDWAPFGEIRTATGTMASPPPWRFAGQLALAGSAAAVWSGSTVVEARAPLVLNSWRAYDPRIGQYLQPEPMLVEGTAGLSHPYAYAYVAPGEFIDRDGRNPGIIVPIIFCFASGVCEVVGAALIGAAVVGAVAWWAFHPRAGDTFISPDDDVCDDSTGTTTGTATGTGGPNDCQRDGSGDLGGYRSDAPSGVCTYSCNDNNGNPDPNPLILDCTDRCPNAVSTLDDYGSFGCEEL